MPLATFSIPLNNEPTQPQPQLQPQSQSQLHGMFLPAGKQNKSRKYAPEDWDAQRPEITRLYENNTIESVIKFMRERHGLDAT